MIKLTDREKKFILVGGVLIVAILISFYGLLPQYYKFKVRIGEYNEKLDLVNKLPKKKSHIEGLRLQVAQGQEVMAIVDMGIPRGKQMSSMIMELEGLLETHHLSKHSFGSQELEEHESFYVLPLKFRISGSFEDIVAFLKAWENHPRIMVFTDLSLSWNEAQANLLGDFSARIFVDKTEDGFYEDLDFPVKGNTGKPDPFAPL